jgi:hypothetical protein
MELACVPPFTPARWAVADGLRVVAGALDHRWSGILELSEATGRGVASWTPPGR